MTELVLMQGIPASGKSKKAAEIAENIDGVRINRDDLRDMLYGKGFEGESFNKWLQKEVKNVEMIICKYYLEKGTSVVIDDTNLRNKTINLWKDFANNMDANFNTHKMNTPYSTCLKRNARRENPVPRKQMERMWETFKELKSNNKKDKKINLTYEEFGRNAKEVTTSDVSRPYNMNLRDNKRARDWSILNNQIVGHEEY